MDRDHWLFILGVIVPIAIALGVMLSLSL